MPRPGDPLDGLWTWRDHPLARFGFVIAILAVLLVVFPILAQFSF